MRNLIDLWIRIKYSPWFRDLPEWLREPPGLYIAAALLLLAAVVLGVLAARRILALFSSVEKEQDKQYRRHLEEEIRRLRRRGDFLGVGQRCEDLGRHRAALDAYRRGGCHAELAALLRRLGKTGQAREAALDGQVWSLYAEISREEGDHREAAQALEREGQPYAAARAWEDAEQPFEAARCYIRAGMEYNAAQLLMKGQDRDTAEALEGAIRSSLLQAKGTAMSPEMVAAVRRAAQLWLAEGEPRRAYALAVAAEQWAVAVPIARDHLAAEPGMIDVCVRAGQPLAAAEVCKKLGEERREARFRAEHYHNQGNSAEAARWFETAEEWAQAAEQWAASGEPGRAADLFARAEEFDLAARLYFEAGDEEKARAMEASARAHDPRTALEETIDTQALPDTRVARPKTVAGPSPAAPPPTPPSAAASSEVLPGDARYHLRKVLGRGGMGVVHEAWDSLLDREVAYKMLPAEDGSGLSPDHLLVEARSAARLCHPNIVQIYDAGRSGQGFFIVMELVRGETFAELLKKRRLSVSGVATVGGQICGALAHAHRRRIVHRDLKPSNLMWADNQVKLTDFGLARAFEESVGKIFTQAAGTPFYMAPEQIRGDPVDTRTDLYSLGCVLFEMLCGRSPFQGGGSIYHHLNSPPVDPRTTRREIPESLARIILHCLEKDPDRRPRSAEEIGRALVAMAA